MQQTPGSVAARHILMTGPIQGEVTCADGTVYDVSAPFIEIPDGAGGHIEVTDADGNTVNKPAHAEEVAHLIGDRYAAEGHPDHTDDNPFVHDRATSFPDSRAATEATQ